MRESQYPCGRHACHPVERVSMRLAAVQCPVRRDMAGSLKLRGGTGDSRAEAMLIYAA